MTFTIDLTNKGLFSGLYETIWLNNDALDAEIEDIIQSGDATENDTLDWTVDAKTYLKKIAETYCNVLSSVFPNSQWVVHELYSPREYNFDTDHIVLEWVNAPQNAKQQFDAFLQDPDTETFEQYDVYDKYGHELLSELAVWTKNDKPLYEDSQPMDKLIQELKNELLCDPSTKATVDDNTITLTDGLGRVAQFQINPSEVIVNALFEQHFHIDGVDYYVVQTHPI
jgi:hypothetical protein